MKFLIANIIFLIILTLECFSQNNPIITNNMGGLIYINDGAIVQVNGTFHNQGTQNSRSKLLNRGNLYIEGDFINDGYAEGDYHIAGLVSGYGYIEVFRNWINNHIFRPGYGTVVLNGSATQWIKGDSVSHFYNLILSGTGYLKKMGKNATVKNMLYLNDKELSTDSFTMYILNENPLAIERTTGFVSSLKGGWLARQVRVKSNYIFPVGSSMGPLRYRPVGIKPLKTFSNANTYCVRFVNNNPTIDSFSVEQKDDEICKVNPRWYHMISKIRGIDTANVRIYYDPSQDREWNTIVHWDIGENNQYVWNPTGENAQTTPDVPGYQGLTTVYGYNDFLPYPFALAYKFPRIDELECVSKICDDKQMHTYSVVNGDPNAIYYWTFDTAVIVGDTSGSSVNVIWENTPPSVGHVSVYMVTEPYYCWSNKLECEVKISPNPVADFIIDSTNISTNEYLHFLNQSTGASYYHWDFGDGITSEKESPYHLYNETNQYNVTLIAYSEEGCTDTITKTITINEYFDVPNIFSPNGDGVNDYFIVNASGIIEFSMLIYNRWGELLFETYNPYIGWNGKTMSGTDVPEGTYYYIIKAKSIKKTYNMHGHLSLVR